MDAMASHISSPSGGSSTYATRPSMPVAPSYSRYHIPKSPFVSNGDLDEFTRATTFLARRFREQGWFQADKLAQSAPPLGIVMHVEDNASESKYIVNPPEHQDELQAVCLKLGLPVMFTMASDITSLLFARVGISDNELTLAPNNITVPIADSLAAIVHDGAGVRRRDYCCFVRKERMVLVWASSADDIMLVGAEVESKLMSSIWGVPIPETPTGMQPVRHSTTNSQRRSRSATPSIMSAPSDAGREKKVGLVNIDEVDLGAEDEESLTAPTRPFLLVHSVMVGLAIGFLIVIESLAVERIVVEIKALGSIAFPRLALLVTIPFVVFIGLFFAIVVIGDIFQLVGPINDVKNGNSKFYSSRKPDIRRHPNMEFPHITIQMPVYKEGLKGVIIPTIESLIPAIRNYESLGGTASIFVCEDGMQAVKPEVAEMRKAFYRANGIGWAARPAHNSDGFQRKGKFKKASNMNYCLSFSLRVEDELLRLMRLKAEAENRVIDSLTLDEEEELYQQAMATILEEDGGKTLAEGNVRMGEVILIIDCDTRVPVDCLSLGALEMAESPDVAIVQHASGVMQVINSVFENAITYFTNLVYLLISFSVGNGDYAPFVGHNAFLRWKAIQSVSFMDGDVEKFWSEDHVSEDFDLSLRLQTAGFVVRLATYDKGEFKEGVSLTAFDELLRWEKYAYGCSELLFNPIHKWLFKGPFTPLFRRFLWSNMKLSSKFTIMGYIGTYYAVGSALPLCLLNYFLTGWYADELDHFYLSSWNMLVGNIFIFVICCPICFAVYRQRLGNKQLLKGLLEAFMWIPFFLIFFGGLSWHLSYALLAHLFSLPIEWSSTAKELDAGGFFVGMERVWHAFKYCIAFMLVLAGGMIYLAIGAPYEWSITTWTSIVPLANLMIGHVGLPLFTILF